jgi:UDP-GlcNAc:undecaprenyl-phosphate/decaprenyl-phosphate GlcNAc-1-phosphate transferase
VSWTASAAGVAFVVFALVIAAVAALRPIAWRLGLVDRPGDRRQHERATPAIGGWAILLALALAYVVLVRPSLDMAGLGLAALVLVVAGALDDIHRLSWRWVLGAQLLAGAIMIELGGVRVNQLGGVFGIPNLSLGPWSDAVTLVATVGIINAINMIDGVDGLAGSVSLAATMMLAAVAAYAGNALLARDLVFVSAALAGFLVYNLRTPWNRRAAIFLGNAGSQLLGLVIAIAAFRLTQNGHHPVSPKLAPFLVAPALIDCLTLIIRRLRLGASPFHGDRNHLHHLLLDAGFSASAVVAVVTGATLVIGVAALLAMKAHAPGLAFTAAFLGLWGAYFLLTRRRDRSVAGLARLATALQRARTAPLAQETGSPRMIEPAREKAKVVARSTEPAI